VIARLTTDESDETRIIEATAAYLIARQRADDLPPQLDLDDVAAAYDGFEDDLRRQLADDQGSADNCADVPVDADSVAEDGSGAARHG
jgi:hypothetical protein